MDGTLKCIIGFGCLAVMIIVIILKTKNKDG